MPLSSKPRGTKRPICRTCDKPLGHYKYFGHPVIDPTKVKVFGYEGNGYFCSLRCGFNWALRQK